MISDEREKAFEEYLRPINLKWEKIPRDRRKTPDYKIYKEDKNKVIVVVEVKGFELCKEEKEWLKSNNLHLEYPKNKDTKRIRYKIKEASEQFENYRDCPCLCVFNNVNTKQTFIGLSNETVMIATFGDLKITFYLDDKNNFRFKEAILERNAPSQILRKKSGSNISAIGILEKINPGYEGHKESIEKFIDENVELLGVKRVEEIIRKRYPELNTEEQLYRLRITHNPFACIKMPLDIFTSPFDEHWVYNNKENSFVKQ